MRPIGRGRSFCPELAGEYLRLQLTFARGEAQKVSSTCPDGCVDPGGFYPPIGTVLRIPWSQVAFIEFRRD